MKNSIIVFTAAMFLGYIISSFVLWDWNPGNWEFTSRLVAACITTFLALGFAGANYR
jgi:hypothetical protein